jgi:hypothetical protein
MHPSDDLTSSCSGRLSREGVLETLQHLNRLASYHVGFRSFTEPYFDSCGVFRDVIISVAATHAQPAELPP